jgi:hypothetical protein
MSNVEGRICNECTETRRKNDGKAKRSAAYAFCAAVEWCFREAFDIAREATDYTGGYLAIPSTFMTTVAIVLIVFVYEFTCHTARFIAGTAWDAFASPKDVLGCRLIQDDVTARST